MMLGLSPPDVACEPTARVSVSDALAMIEAWVQKAQLRGETKRASESTASPTHRL
jgi:hypothetical protein